MPTCEMCGRPLQAADRGRPRQYCSRACRARAYRLRVADRSEPEVAHAAPEVPGQEDSVSSLSLPRIVRAAIELADRDGTEAVSMRRTAAHLEVGVMSLYRYVSSREELNDLIVDTVFGARPLPEPGPDGWRARLELSARQEWDLYREHPWMPQLVAVTTRPPLAPNLMAYTDWRMRAVDGYGLDFAAMVQIAIMISTYVQSAAMPLAREREAARATRRTRQQWVEARQEAIRRTLPAERLPMVSRFGGEAYEASQPESIFEFGLHRMLDGVAALLDKSTS
ncbi:TetR/AcrR family transcriptional regulator [Solihabitans fulvus]|uniref:TetR/AcrR family transcriptional regulator n=1 Tax=Solihabitans fulvus TaxID=1892852 RepID=UPI001661B5D2|nr:TetR/AcrR family transcriptional regulator [Solihabitans fulvus]